MQPPNDGQQIERSPDQPCGFGGPWRRPSRREKTEVLKDYIAELKEELQDAEERLKDLEK